MSVSRTAFTRIHRDALPTVKRRTSERTKARMRALNALLCPSVRASTRTSNAFHLTHREVTRSGQSALGQLPARCSECSEKGHTHTREREERERGTAACLAACPFLTPFFLPQRVSPFGLFALHLPSFPSFTTLHERRNALHVVQKKLKFFFQKTIAGYCRMYGDDKK